MLSSKNFALSILFSFVITFSWILYFDASTFQNEILQIKKSTTKACGRFPTEEHITIDNEIWQLMQLPKGFVRILNAYLDTRQNESVVRLNVNSVQINISDNFFCQFWFNDVIEPTVVAATEVLSMWGKVKLFMFLLGNLDHYSKF